LSKPGRTFTVVQCPICSGNIAGSVDPPDDDFMDNARHYGRSRGFVIATVSSAVLNGCECERELRDRRLAAQAEAGVSQL
jgi:hypothetical protein